MMKRKVMMNLPKKKFKRKSCAEIDEYKSNFTFPNFYLILMNKKYENISQ